MSINFGGPVARGGAGFLLQAHSRQFIVHLPTEMVSMARFTGAPGGGGGNAGNQADLRQNRQVTQRPD